jgi:hypothetical protein
MRPVQLGVLAGSLAAAVCLFVAGCGVVDRDEEPISRNKKKGGGSQFKIETVKLDPVKGDYKGVIKGKVVWQGAEPDLADATANLQKTISGNADARYCLSGTALEKVQQSYRIGKNQGLGNVFVWIAPPKGQVFDVPDDQLPKQKQVTLSQPHCAFLPHCVTVFGSRFNFKESKQDAKDCQVLVVQNDASVPHNASMKGGPLNGSRDQLLSRWSGEGPTTKAIFDQPPLKPERDAVKISCGIHGWMAAWVRVFDHPYNAVTSVGADLKDLKKPVWENLDSDEVGTFEIKGAPVGAKVTLFAWHEELGHLLGQAGKEITIDADAAKNAQEITAKAK